MIKISVRNLVEFILQTGDIDNTRKKGFDKDAMHEGSRLHKKIQNKQKINYNPEVPLKYTIKTDKYDICIEGRADGIIVENAGKDITVDEIKCMYKDVYLIEEPIEVHRAQALCYAYIYTKDKQCNKIGIRLTYCNIETEQLKFFNEIITYEKLEEWFEKLITEYKKWTDFQYHWNIVRQQSIKPLEFPFEYRAGQRELAVSVYKTISQKKHLFIQAPTGVGKTMSVLFPAVKALGTDIGSKIFYLTAKTITSSVAKEAVNILNDRGLKVKSISITAKEKICPLEKSECNPQGCEYAGGHYDRINNAVFEFINENNVMDRDNISKAAQKYKVCPFEMSLDIASWCDIIICDYNYVFDPNVKLKRFFADELKGDYIFLIDEAHNLVERGREMYSACLYKEDFLEIKKHIREYNVKLIKSLSKCNTDLLAYKRECNDYNIILAPDSLYMDLLKVLSRMDNFLDNYRGNDRDELLEFYLNVRNFTNIYEILDENYIIYTQHDEQGRFMLKLFCVNPALNLKQCLDKGISTVFFSATLIPVNYYKSLLSTKKNDYAVYINSPFAKENRLIVIGSDISSRYVQRNEFSYARVVSYIKTVTESKKGNYIVFFPSYEYMKEIADRIDNEENTFKDYKIIFQKQRMNEQEREDFLDIFEKNSGVIGFCVVGGIFSEGIDLKGDSLIGVIIVGTCLPKICSERKILKEYYDNKDENGFNYAYKFPAINKVLQAAGRVIRTVEDKGIIILLDSRFNTREYLELFPREWDDCILCNANNIERIIYNFWNNKPMF